MYHCQKGNIDFNSKSFQNQPSNKISAFKSMEIHSVSPKGAKPDVSGPTKIRF